MKKYLKLTANQAIRHFILGDGTLGPETDEDIRNKLSDLDRFSSDFNVTLQMPTHRTKPDYLKDRIVLKNLISDTEKALYGMTQRRTADLIVANLMEAEESIDFSLGLDSMLVFANERFASVVKLPVPAQEKVSIGPLFDVLPLYRTREQNRRYLILTVSRHKFRLLEAHNDKIVQEFDDENFPFENTEYYTTDPKKLAQDDLVDNLTREYFNVADKNLQIYTASLALPVVLMGDVKMISYFLEMMDDECTVIGHIHGNYDQAQPHEIIETARPVVELYRREKDKSYLKMLDDAASGKVLETDPGKIDEAVAAGDARTLFIPEPGQHDDWKKSGVTEGQDLLRLVRRTQLAGGNILLFSDDLRERYDNPVLIKRY